MVLGVTLAIVMLEHLVRPMMRYSSHHRLPLYCVKCFPCVTASQLNIVFILMPRTLQQEFSRSVLLYFCSCLSCISDARHTRHSLQ